jgi:aminopeptidase
VPVKEAWHAVRTDRFRESVASVADKPGVLLALGGRVCDNVIHLALRDTLDGQTGRAYAPHAEGGWSLGLQIDEERRAMKDERDEILAQQLLNYSLDLQRGERLMVEVCGHEALELAKVVIRQATAKGAIPFWHYNDPSLQRQWIGGATQAQYEAFTHVYLHMLDHCEAWLIVRAEDNPFDLADLRPEQVKMYQKLYLEPVLERRRSRGIKWCLLRYPSNSVAQLSEMSREAYADLYYNVCCLDYAGMSAAMDRLVGLFESTDMVHIVRPGTDLTFSIKGIPSMKWDGKSNLPDGELMTAPVRDSVNGTITYNTPGLYQGAVFHDIRFTIEDGRIVDASCHGDNDRLNAILDTDEGARYFGEFALGLNPFILHPSRDVLFTEKIAGSFHLTPGNCYEDASNGNHSAIHWDLVQIQREDYGGGEIYFDGELVRKDGVFVDAELERSFSGEALGGIV